MRISSAENRHTACSNRKSCDQDKVYPMVNIKTWFIFYVVSMQNNSVVCCCSRISAHLEFYALNDVLSHLDAYLTSDSHLALTAICITLKGCNASRDSSAAFHMSLSPLCRHLQNTCSVSVFVSHLLSDSFHQLGLHTF